ncbi:MAG: TolC family protein [Mucinivorans sp.]
MKHLFLILLSLGSLSLAAQEQDSLLVKYRNMALDYSHDLKAAQKNIAQSMEFEKMARADTKPQLSADVNFQFTGNPMELNLSLPNSGGDLSFRGQQFNYGVAVTLLQPIYTGGRLLESIRIARGQQSLATSTADFIRSGVCFQTDIQYWTAVARAEMVTIAADFRRSVSELVTTIEQRVAAGLIDPAELLMAQVRLNEADYQLLQAQANFTTGRMALNSLIGVELNSQTTIQDTVPMVELGEQPVEDGQWSRAEIRMAKDKIRLSESSLKLNDSKYKPQFYVGAQGSYSAPGYNFKPDLDPNYALYAKLSVPIFEWGKRRSEKRASKEQIGMAEDNLAKVQDDVALEVETARTALSQAIARARLAQLSLDKARENERQAMERYENGKVSVLEVLDSQMYRQNSQMNYTQAKVATQSHYSELLKALNRY